VRGARYPATGIERVPAKSDALWFFEHRRRGSPPDGLSVTINGEAVPANLRMRYLGLIIDSQWTFGPHFEHLVRG
jgi:hypothetical protein